jgi:hypothetical protein
MHPIERLRYVARSGSSDPALLVSEAAGALATFADEEVALVTACRRLVDRHLSLGAMWWLASRVLVSGDPEAEAVRLVQELQDDCTDRLLSDALPEDSVVTVVGWPETTRRALVSRGDVTVRVVDSAGEAAALGRFASHVDAETVPSWGVGAAAAGSSLVLLEATALGASGFVAASGSRAAGAVARTSDVPVWVVAGVGTVLPEPLWAALSRRFSDSDDEPWHSYDEIVPTSLVDGVVGPRGLSDAKTASRETGCPVAPELLRQVSA